MGVAKAGKSTIWRALMTEELTYRIITLAESVPAANPLVAEHGRKGPAKTKFHNLLLGSGIVPAGYTTSEETAYKALQTAVTLVSGGGGRFYG